LSEDVVDLVRAGMVELVAFQIKFGAAEMPRQPLGKIKRARPSHIVLEVSVELGLKARVAACGVVGGLNR
jgi:hypothetical protein